MNSFFSGMFTCKQPLACRPKGSGSRKGGGTNGYGALPCLRCPLEHSPNPASGVTLGPRSFSSKLRQCSIKSVVWLLGAPALKLWCRPKILLPKILSSGS